MIRWFKEGRLLTDQERYQTYSETRSGVLVLIIKNPGEKDLGRYECEVWYCSSIFAVFDGILCQNESLFMAEKKAHAGRIKVHLLARSVG